MLLHFFPRLLAVLLFFCDKLVSDLVLVDVGHIDHGLSSDLLRGNHLHVVEPDIGIEASLGCVADPSG